MLSSFLLRKVSQKDIHESRKDEPRVLSLAKMAFRIKAGDKLPLLWKN